MTEREVDLSGQSTEAPSLTPKYAPLRRKDVSLLLNFISDQWLPLEVSQAYNRLRKEAGL